jgi:hypothetical protein
VKRVRHIKASKDKRNYRGLNPKLPDLSSSFGSDTQGNRGFPQAASSRWRRWLELASGGGAPAARRRGRRRRRVRGHVGGGRNCMAAVQGGSERRRQHASHGAQAGRRRGAGGGLGQRARAARFIGRGVGLPGGHAKVSVESPGGARHGQMGFRRAGRAGLGRARRGLGLVGCGLQSNCGRRRSWGSTTRLQPTGRVGLACG